MALKATVGSLEDVPEEARGFYEETDDGYRLAVDEIDAHPDVRGLKENRDKLLKEAKETQRRLEELESEIPDDWQDRLEEWEQLKEKEKERERKKAEERGEWEKLREQLREQHAEQLAEREQRIETVERQLEQKIVDEAITQAASEHDAYAHLLPEYAKRFVQVEERDGQKVPVVVDDGGNRRINDDGDDMSISELVAWMKDEERFQPLFKPSGSSGAGAGGSGGAGGPGGSSKPIRDMSDQEKQDFIDEHGLDEFRAKLRNEFS